LQKNQPVLIEDLEEFMPFNLFELLIPLAEVNSQEITPASILGGWASNAGASVRPSIHLRISP
jgi:hypothetical protein